MSHFWYLQDAFNFVRSLEAMEGRLFMLRDAVGSTALQPGDQRSFAEAHLASNTSLLVVELEQELEQKADEQHSGVSLKPSSSSGTSSSGTSSSSSSSSNYQRDTSGRSGGGSKPGMTHDVNAAAAAPSTITRISSNSSGRNGLGPASGRNTGNSKISSGSSNSSSSSSSSNRNDIKSVDLCTPKEKKKAVDAGAIFIDLTLS